MSDSGAELRVESHRALERQTEKQKGCSECGSGDEGPGSFLSNTETPSRRHLDKNTSRGKIRDTISASQVMEAASGEDESSPRGAKTPKCNTCSC